MDVFLLVSTSMQALSRALVWALWLIGKRVVDLLLVLIELFTAWNADAVYSDENVCLSVRCQTRAL